jgi:hypothetical protein
MQCTLRPRGGLTNLLAVLFLGGATLAGAADFQLPERRASRRKNGLG